MQPRFQSAEEAQSAAMPQAGDEEWKDAKKGSSTPKKEHRIVIPHYTLGEELISAISHGIGSLLGVAALVLCIVKSCSPFRGYSLASSIVYGFTIVLLYTMSCLYHALKVNRAKRVFRVFDHCTIFLLIAGTYTPYCLITLRQSSGWWIFGIIWLMAVLGVVFNAISLRRFAKVSVVLYLVMGWMIVASFSTLKAQLAPQGLSLLLWGGVAYTVGAVLYALGAKRKYFHSVFHFFCLAGSLLHFLSIYGYVI